MRDDERLFSFGVAFFLFALLSVAVFHAVFNSDDRHLREQKARIVMLGRDLANASVRFHELTRPEVLRPLVMQVYPDYRPVGTGRAISVKNMR